MIEIGETLIKRACWNCGSEVTDLYFCSSCASLQPLPERIDYFACFGLGYRLKLDLKELEAVFYDLSRKFHPDFYQRKPQEEKIISLENAAVLNKAYRTLKDPVRRIEYLIGLAEGEGEVPTEPPSDLFDEIFEVQEGLEEIKAAPADSEAQRTPLLETLSAAKGRFRERQEQGRKELETLAERWDALEGFRRDRTFTDAQRACMKEMKKVLSHRAYLERIINDIDTAMGKGK